MKQLLLSLSALALASTAFADIQDPPMNEQGPTRKFGRGISNLLYGVTEIPQTIAEMNVREGNSAAAGYGIIKGSGRALVRIGAGLYEFVTFPFPLHRDSFRPVLRPNVPWIHGGYAEFPPELGWQTRKKYNTTEAGY